MTQPNDPVPPAPVRDRLLPFSATDASGEVVRLFNAHESVAAASVPEGGRLLAGHLDAATHWVDMGTGQVVAYTDAQAAAKASVPSPWHRWDNATMAWAVRDAQALLRVRRRDLLAAIEQLELRQARPLRELALAQAAGVEPPAAALAVARDVEAQITVLRAQLAALA